MKDEPAWEVLSSEYLHRSAWLTVRKERLKLPDGRELPEYYVLEYPDWINVIALTADDRMVLVRQYRHALGRTSFELPAGVRESKDAAVIDAAKRELLEETGYGGGEWSEFMVLSANPSTTNNLTYTFLARNVVRMKEPELDATEHLTCHLFSCKEVRRMLEEGEFIQSLMAAPLWKFFSLDI